MHFGWFHQTGIYFCNFKNKYQIEFKQSGNYIINVFKRLSEYLLLSMFFLQGFHDVVVTFLLVIGEDLTYAVMDKLTQKHLRYVVGKSSNSPHTHAHTCAHSSYT